MNQENTSIPENEKLGFSYDKTMLELYDIMEYLQDEQIKIDDITEKVQKANELIAMCRLHLHQIQAKLVTNDVAKA